jgi:predicted N-acetyltransferase YhbS
MDGDTRAAVEWLLDSTEPAIRGMARRDLLDEPEPPDLKRVTDGALVVGLKAGQTPRGDFGNHPYRKWTGAHWRLVSLVELEVPAGEPRAMAALDGVLDWLSARNRLARVPTTPSGLPLSDASIEGNALAVACRLGAADDPRAGMLAEALLRWQWPDGGWNCDRMASGRRSSFHESLIPMWALWEYARASGSTDAAAASSRAAELFLSHRLFRRGGTGPRIHPSWTVLHYPAYWHYDIGQAPPVGAHRPRPRPEGRGRPGAARGATPARRALASRRGVVASPRLVSDAGGGRLGRGCVRDAHAERAAHPSRRGPPVTGTHEARLRALSTGALTRAEIDALRQLMDEAFAGDEHGGFSDEDWEHALGGTHLLAEEAGRIVGHASVVERDIRVAGRPLRTGYVEAVATAVGRQRSGIGTRLLREVASLLAAYELGVLGTGSHAFYERLGWVTWRGPSSVRTAEGERPTPEEDGYIMVLGTPLTPELDLDDPISCEWRPGDVW